MEAKNESIVYTKIRQRIQSGQWNTAEAFIISNWGASSSQSIYAQILCANLACRRGYLDSARNFIYVASNLGALDQPDLQEDIKELLTRLGNVIEVNGRPFTIEGVPSTIPWPEMPEFEVRIILNALKSFDRPVQVLEWGKPNSMVYFQPQIPSGSRWDLINKEASMPTDSKFENHVENTRILKNPNDIVGQYDVIIIDGKDKKDCLKFAQEKCSQTGLIFLRGAHKPELCEIKLPGMMRIKLQNANDPSSPAIHIFVGDPTVARIFLETLKLDPFPYLKFELDMLEPTSLESTQQSSYQTINTVSGFPEELKKAIDDLVKEGGPLRLHIGCGTVYKPGWINIDNNSDQNISQLDLNWDLRKPLPFPNGSVDMIYHEHFLEHLSVEEGMRVLEDFKRVLKVGGIMRIAMPDLDDVIKNYLDPNWKSLPFLNQFGMNHIKTRAELINISFRSWGHQHLYDSEELHRRLQDAGFNRIIPCKIRESQHPDLQFLESRDESTLVAEVIK